MFYFKFKEKKDVLGEREVMILNLHNYLRGKEWRISEQIYSIVTFFLSLYNFGAPERSVSFNWVYVQQERQIKLYIIHYTLGDADIMTCKVWVIAM